jgi:hypothetical protein
MSFISICIVCLVIGCILATPQFLQDRVEFRGFKNRVRTKMQRWREAGIDPRRICTSQEQLWEIRQRHERNGYLSEDDITVLAANQLIGEQQEGRQAMMAVAFENWANKNLAKPADYQGSITMVPPDVEARARQYAKDFGKQALVQMEAAVEQKRQDEALMREFQIAQEAMTVWARANPNDPLAQRVIAALLEVSQTPGAMEDEVPAKTNGRDDDRCL